ncbi:oxygenase MpaB family protein [Mycobacteroides abscessus]|uniref:oxygenase MpaB family protein n=1 Tax=Mycobacteroides abscessus TaxID=36809 RepID=UPI002104846D|nr:oxygenase MpaB family protein [Mycobacteroides abscessus]
MFPTESVARRLDELLQVGDPAAERFYTEVYHGPIGRERGTELLDRALARGIDSVPDAPDSMRALFEEFESLPAWLDRTQLERGAATWRRWAYDFSAMANAGTMDMYTEAWLALPLSLSGGYSGDTALNRFLETTRWWIECARESAIVTPGSVARTITMKVRIMHVAVRRGVSSHPSWDQGRWGTPISQSQQLLTLMAGSVIVSLSMYALGYITTHQEMLAVLHFCRYLGHLLGLQPCSDVWPTTVADALRVVSHFEANRVYDGGAEAVELVESFVPSFSPATSATVPDRIRGMYHLTIQGGFTRYFMLPWNRKKYRLPRAAVGTVFLVLRSPFITTVEIFRHASPAIDRFWQRHRMAAWERWLNWQAGGAHQQYHAPNHLAGDRG